MHTKLDNAIEYFPCNSTEKKILPFINTTSIPCILHTSKHAEELKLISLKKNHNWHEELRSHFFTLQNLYRQLSVYVHHLLYRNYYISYSLCAGLVWLHLIPQVHYINNATSHNKSSHAIHTNLICTEQSCRLKEINRQTANTKCRFIIV